MNLVYSILLLLFFINPVFSQTFITLDEDTAEFITDVNFTTFKNNKLISKGVTLTDEATTIKVDFDSISFDRLDYKTAGFRREQLDSVIFLKKSTIYLDEIVLSNKDNNQIDIGEKNRFVRSQARTFSKELLYGTVFRNESDVNLNLDKATIFVNKVKFRTAYKLNFYTIQESLAIQGNQDIKYEELIFSTDTLFLKPGTKGEIPISIIPRYKFPAHDKVLVTIELINYFDEEGNTFCPKNNQLTELKFQLSNNADYYAKLINLHTHELTPNLRNINLMINYDFAHRFFKKPHKSIIVAPAILLYGIKE